jgi:hypothetical protein
VREELHVRESTMAIGVSGAAAISKDCSNRENLVKYPYRELKILIVVPNYTNVTAVTVYGINEPAPEYFAVGGFAPAKSVGRF